MGLPSTARAFFRYTERVEGNAMDAIDGNAVLLSMVIGGIGFVAFAYGKKQSRYPQMVAGLLLMGYPYFVSNVWAMLGIGAAIVAALFVVVKLGG
jgi:hypothetical protein